MAARQGRRTASGRYAYQRQTTNGRIYVDGNTARELDVRTAIHEKPRKTLSNTVRKNREKAHHMSIGYVLFLAAALTISGMILINYIQLQFAMSDHIKEIAELENRLNVMKQLNDDEYTRIVSNIDLEEIKRIAIGELGMIYATEGQIITFTNEGSDYVRQYADIPE